MNDEIPVRCPSCSEVTVSLKRYEIIKLLVFLGVFAYHQRATYTQCPSCMRSLLVKNALINLIPANVLWFIVVLPMNTIQLLRSYTKGHSSSVQAELG